MSVINGIIQPRSFEVVRDRIGAILADEIANQATLAADATLNAMVWLERFVPFDKTDFPAIDVSLARGLFDGHTSVQTDGNYTYHIDGYVNAKSKNDEDGDVKAMLKLHKILGWCQAILEDPKYRTLGFAPPFVASRRASEIAIAEPNAQDATSSVMGRLIFTVKVPETFELISPVLAGGNDTTVKLVETDKGYKYILDAA